MGDAAPIRIADEAVGDAQSIRALIEAAFRSAPHSGGNEQDIVDGLRAAGALSLSLVARPIAGDAILGYLAASPVTVGGAGGWFGIGPLAVRPCDQSRGIGSALMSAAVERLRAAGAAGAVLVGEPDFYARFGFLPDPGLSVPGIPPEYVLALPLTAHPAQGQVSYHPAFGLDPG